MLRSFRVYDLLKQQYIADEAMYFFIRPDGCLYYLEWRCKFVKADPARYRVEWD